MLQMTIWETWIRLSKHNLKTENGLFDHFDPNVMEDKYDSEIDSGG